MSREDPQFKLRMPIELRAQVEQAAKNSGRSLNSELVARIEGSFVGASTLEKLMPAERARELALMARAGIPDEIRRRAIEAIARAVRLGHSNAAVEVGDLHLDVGIPDADLDNLINEVTQELSAAGYKVSWDDITAICIEF
ncbi:Arc family DNA-binding protein [Metapseudomonas boanensis]|uniref:Arc family DNA-binding protein n=1 Tax=Metapseudomonas boanensis TaxID=2822138 RepID=A0ABS5XMV1_9GAMM|nr:Arc family DNA-binding protein [Pseudomonas boanensis]MBT8767567.1 Arc family DNA-binding protein [Pseudomonas boanensis]